MSLKRFILLPLMLPAMLTANPEAGASMVSSNVPDLIHSSDIADTSQDFLISIPKQIVMDKITKSGSYEIMVNGTLDNNMEITVSVLGDNGSDEFSMEYTGGTPVEKPAIKAKLSQQTFLFTPDEVNDSPDGIMKKGMIQAPDMTMGSWEGTIIFDIGFHDINTVSGNVPTLSGNVPVN